MSELLSDWSFVVRRVRNKPYYFNKDGTISSALFKDSQGVSVDKDHNRDLEEIIADEERLHKLCCSSEEQMNNPEYRLVALVSIEKNVCEEKAIEVIDDPIPDINPHHCLLYKNMSKEKLTQSQARALSTSAKIIKEYQ